MKYMHLLINSGKTVFNREDIFLLLDIDSIQTFYSFIKRAKQQQILFSPYNGLWTFQNYNRLELACKLRKNAYISLETVLYEQGIIFQPSYSAVYCVSDDSRTYTIDNTTYHYHTIKDSILFDFRGIQNKKTYMIATPERALCDFIYLHPKATVENITGLDTATIDFYLQIYPKSTRLSIKKLIKNAQS